jgi:hypothetical protein
MDEHRQGGAPVTIPPPIPEPEIPQPHEPGIESPREEPRPSFRGPRSLRTNPHRPKRSRRQATIRSAPESRSRRETHATPIDDIEIDGSFVAGMGRARNNPGSCVRCSAWAEPCTCRPSPKGSRNPARRSAPLWPVHQPTQSRATLGWHRAPTVAPPRCRVVRACAPFGLGRPSRC